MSVLFCLLLSLCSVAAESDCLYYFYGEKCASCPETNKYISDLESRYNLQIQKYEVYYDAENNKLMQSYFDAYGVAAEAQEVPAVFIGNTDYIG